MDHDHTTILAAPKRGGILQSSGFLDLQSLMALSRTCKANMIDEQSLILLIENEITRSRGVDTKEEAIVFLRNIYRWPLLKLWLERDYGCTNGTTTTTEIKVTRHMLTHAVPYEVMLSKMLRAVPTQLERLELVKNEWRGVTVLPHLRAVWDQRKQTILHRAASSGNHESLKTVLALFPESERLQVVSMQDSKGRTVLHFAAESGNSDSIKTLLSLHPESERLKVVNSGHREEHTVLHAAARSGSFEAIETILSLYPESERQALNTTI